MPFCSQPLTMTTDEDMGATETRISGTFTDSFPSTKLPIVALSSPLLKDRHGWVPFAPQSGKELPSLKHPVSSCCHSSAIEKRVPPIGM